MKRFLLATLAIALLSQSVFAGDTRLGGLQLLPGYKHIKLQGIDSVVGEIKKTGGLHITYEIGAVTKPGLPRIGGGFSDRPKLTPKQNVRWYHEQTVNGQPVHLAYRKDNMLMVSYPTKGMNFSVTVRSADEMAEALLMILTYANPIAKKNGKAAK